MEEVKRVIYKSNGAKAVFEYTEESLQYILKDPMFLERLAEEIKKFNKHFWDMIEENWSTTCENTEEYYFDYFDPSNILKPYHEGKTYYFDDLETGKWIKEAI